MNVSLILKEDVDDADSTTIPVTTSATPGASSTAPDVLDTNTNTSTVAKVPAEIKEGAVVERVLDLKNEFSGKVKSLMEKHMKVINLF